MLPAVTLVTGTDALDEPAATVTMEGTVATLGLLEEMLKVKPPAGAAEDSVKVRFWVAPMPEMLSVEGTKPWAVPTSTGSMSPVRPLALALIVAEPGLPPVRVT